MSARQGAARSTSAGSEPDSFRVRECHSTPCGQFRVQVRVLVVLGSRSKQNSLHISDVSPSESVSAFKDRVAQSLVATAGLPVRGPDSVDLLIGGTLVHDSLLSDYGVLSPGARSIWAVAFYTQHPPELGSTLALERPPSAGKAPLPPILLRESTGTCALATETETKALQSGECVAVDVTAIIFYGLRGHKRSCTIPVSQQTTVQQLEEKLIGWMGFCPTELSVMFQGTELNHESVVFNCGVDPGSIIEVIAWYDTHQKPK